MVVARPLIPLFFFSSWKTNKQNKQTNKQNMLYEIALVTTGAILSIIWLVVMVLFVGKRKARSALQQDRSILKQLKKTTPPEAASTQLGDQITSGTCTITLCDDNNVRKVYEDVALKINLPMLFLTSKTGDRIGTVLLERCVCQLVKTMSKKGKPRHRWSCFNYLLLSSKGSTKQETLIKVGSNEYSYCRLQFPLNRELERYHSILNQGCSWSSPGHHTKSAMGKSWRHSLLTLTEGLSQESIPPSGPEAVISTILGRLLFHWQGRPAFSQYILKKINKQLSKIAPPSNLKGGIQASEVTVGEVLPVLSNPVLKKANAVGDVEVEFDVKYTGGEFSIVLDLDFDISLKSFDVEIPLPRVFTTITVQHLEGRLCASFSSVSDYIWLGFVTEPDVHIAITSDIPNAPVRLTTGLEIPELTELVVTYLKSEVIQLMVLPNMEDVYLPLINEVEKEDITDVVTEAEVESEVRKTHEKKEERAEPVTVTSPVRDKQVQSPSHTPAKEKPALGKVKVNATSLFGDNTMVAARRSSIIPSVETSPAVVPTTPSPSTPPPTTVDNDSLVNGLLPKTATASSSFSADPTDSSNPSMDVDLGSIVGKMQQLLPVVETLIETAQHVRQDVASEHRSPVHAPAPEPSLRTSPHPEKKVHIKTTDFFGGPKPKPK
eukprot:TRINITY_DN4785_c0_g3_i1.p1 TRINITY_DN4785_c0_g3~~TRINITY_DN4785_c0_g3_i1.p1  ORF type:complete len:662 (+),score=99.94 TRINITY_DN4785_c0_g3_i1:1782-3767(+)